MLFVYSPSIRVIMNPAHNFTSSQLQLLF